MKQPEAGSIRYRAYTNRNISAIPQFGRLSADQRSAVEAVSRVLPFRVNNYIVEELIDWDDIPNDPIFQLTFPQEAMLDPSDYARVRGLIARRASQAELDHAVSQIRDSLNPHPAGQMELNVPTLDDEPVSGMQHKYRETVLFFPTQGQTCHAYCTYCFRWAQFVGRPDLRFAASEAETLVRYLRRHPEVRDVLVTGGDPMIMRASVLRSYVEPLMAIDSLRSIRIGTKALAWWPYRFLTDPDADALLGLFEEVVGRGKHLALMAHSSHPRELSTDAAGAAVRRIRSTGAVIRAQAPLIRHVNDRADVWARMWQQQVDMGIVPYYMFVERDTGPRDYFSVPLRRGYEVFSRAFSQISGLGRTVRGPSMSCTPGKVLIDGITEIGEEKVFVLKFIQGRNPAWTNRIFFAAYDPEATWIDELEPAFGDRFFFEETAGESRQWKPLRVYSGTDG